MPNPILLKKSSVAAKVPLASDIDFGELALNYADGRLYYKTSSLSIKYFITFDDVAAGLKTINGAQIIGTGDLVVTDNTKLPLSGGTMTGLITTRNNNVGIAIGDDIYLADRNIANTLVLEGGQVSTSAYINFGTTSQNLLGTTNTELTWRASPVLTNANLASFTSSYLKNNQATTTIGSGVTGAIWLDISNPGVGNPSGFNFLKSNDGAGLQVTEYNPDNTLYEFFMSDNPDGGDQFSWRFTNWEGSNGLWNPMLFNGLDATLAARNIIFHGKINQPHRVWFTTRNSQVSNASTNIASYNNPAYLRIAGSSALVITQLNISNYTGNSGQTISFRFPTTTTFEWGHGQMSFTAIQNLPLTDGSVTLSNGIVVTFANTASVVANSDQFQCRVWRLDGNELGLTQFSGNVYPQTNTGINLGRTDRYWSNVYSQVFTSNVANGTSPFVVTSQTKVDNLNVDLLDGYSSEYYLNATNLSSGTLSAARLPALSGDISTPVGSGITTLSNSGIAPGTYTKVTFDIKGRATSGGALLASDIPILNQNTTGNSAQSDRLSTPRTINGVPFDGTQDIVISASPNVVNQSYTATSGQTVFTVTGGYTPNQLSVYLNGVKLVSVVDVDVSNGTTFTLTQGAIAGQSVEVIGHLTSVTVIQNMMDDAMAMSIALG